MQAAESRRLGDGDLETSGVGLGLFRVKNGLRMIKLRLVIAWVKSGEDGSCGDVVIVFHIRVHIEDRPAHPRAELREVSVNLRIVSGFKLPGIEPPREAAC